MPILDSHVMDGAPAVDRPRSSSIASVSYEAQQAMLHRARFLGRKDEMLLRQMMKGNLSLRELGSLVGADAGTICRRVARLVARLRDPLVIAVTDDRCPLAPDYRQLAIEHFLQGMTVPQLADLHQMKAHAVREMLTYIRGWHKGLIAGATLMEKRYR